MNRYQKTIWGTGILLAVLVLSFLYPLYGPEDYDKHTILVDKNANVIGRAPFPPTFNHPFGTDENGQDLLLMMINGVKYTLLAAFLITTLRVFIGGITGIVLSLWLPKMVPYFKDIFLGFRYVPTLIIAITLMAPFAFATPDIPIVHVITYQILVLFIVGYPSVSISTLDILNDLKRRTFIDSSYLMGANNLFILKRHLKPYLKSHGLLLTVQQFLATLVLIMHLGLFEFFLGGQTVGGTFGYDLPPKAASLSNEWAGLIGQNFRVFVRYPWIVLVVMIGFFFLIATVNMIKKELEEVMKQENFGLKKKVQREQQEKNEIQMALNPSSFVFTSYHSEKSAKTKPISLFRKPRKKKIIYAILSTAAVISFLIFFYSFSDQETKEVNVESKKTAIKHISPVVSNSSFQEQMKQEEEAQKVARTFNFKQTVNKTEDAVIKLWGDPERTRKMILTFTGDVKVPATSYFYSKGNVEITFIDGKAQIITLYFSEFCNYSDGLQLCLSKKGLDVENKFDTKGLPELASKAKYAYNADGFELIEIKRWNVSANDHMVSSVMGVTKKEYYPIIQVDWVQ